LVPSHGGLVPFGPQLSAIVRRVRTALGPLKLALDERDYWNRAAHAHEASEFSTMARNSRASRSRGGRGNSSSSTGTRPSNRDDLRIRPPDQRSVPRSVPRNLLSRITWDVVKISTTITSATGGITETNFRFDLNTHPQVASWTALFDQWTIPMASVSFESTMPPGATIAPAVMYTALDFDNNAIISTVAAIEDFASCDSHPMTPQMTFVRSVKPCCKSTLQSSGSLVNAGTERLWVDSSQPTISFFGIRSILSATVGGTYSIAAVTTIYYAFRNPI
jgi:hypothetical protein